MIAWRRQFPWYRKPLGYWRLMAARVRYYDTLGLQWGLRPKVVLRSGYARRMWAWHNRYAGRPGFVIGNGPSLEKMNLAPLRRHVTIGSNGIYKKFDDWGWSTNYLLFEDLDQTELRGPEIHGISGTTKIAALHNAYAFKADASTYFANVRYGNAKYWETVAPRFGDMFCDVSYLGSTVTYLGIQLAYFLGCNPVYLIGVDHNYGKLPELFPPGKIEITEENHDLVKQCHFDESYYKLGDVIGVPDVQKQDDAYQTAMDHFQANGREIYNAGVNSSLDIFPRIDFQEALDQEKSRAIGRDS